MNIWLLYLMFAVLPNAAKSLDLACFMAAVAILITIPIWLTCLAEEKVRAAARAIGWIKAEVIAIFVFMVFAIFVPSEKQVWTIAGGYAATNDAELKKLPDNLLKTANDFLQKAQAKLAPEEKPEK